MFSELHIIDRRLVEPILEMVHRDGRPYVVYLVEDLMVNELLRHYRLMTSGFTILKYCKEINSTWLKWEPNNNMNEVLGVTEVDDSYFKDAQYYINDVPVPTKSHFVPDAVRAVSVRHSQYFGDRVIAVHGQKIEEIQEDEYVAHNFGALLKMDGYSNGCIFVDDIPASDHLFQTGQAVKCNEDSVGQISRVIEDGVCIKIVDDHEDEDMAHFRWFDGAKYLTELTLNLTSQENLCAYDFAVVETNDNNTTALSTVQKYKFSQINKFEIPYDSRLAHIYVRKRDDDECAWGEICTINYPDPKFLSMQQHISDGIISVDDFLKILQKTHFEITDGETFLERCKFNLRQDQEELTKIANHPLLFAVTAYRKRLVIERLIVELNLWATDWIHSILEQKRKDKPMIKWLVEDRKVTKLHDHYRVYTSFNVHSSALLNCRWLKHSKNTKMNGKPGFGDADDSCFEATMYAVDDAPITPTTASVSGSTHRITVKNQNLFGDRVAVINKFEDDAKEEVNAQQHFTYFVHALKVDQYSNGCVFVDDIPPKIYPFSEGQHVQFDDEMKGQIRRVTVDKLCVKMDSDDDNLSAFRWIYRSEAPQRLTLKFNYLAEISDLLFAAVIGQNDESPNVSGLKGSRFSGLSNFRIPCPGLLNQICRISVRQKAQFSDDGRSVRIGVFAKPRSGGYQWTRIKTVEYALLSQHFVASAPLSARGDNKATVESLFKVLMERENEMMGLPTKKERISECMALITSHPKLFDETAYRRRLVIERLVVELRLWDPKWIHRILDEKVKDKPMLQWLVEERRVARLFEHYRVHMSRFKVQHSALLNRRWLEFQENTKMNGEPGFDYVNNSCFQATAYKAGGVTIDENTLVVPGTVHRITISNINLFGDQSVVLQEFEQKHDDDYFSADFANALQFDGEYVFLNHVPSDSYPFCVGQELVYNDEMTGIICQIISDAICIKTFVHDRNMLTIRWIKKSEIPNKYSMAFRYRAELEDYKFVVNKGRTDQRTLSGKSAKHFRNINLFELNCNSLILEPNDQVCIYAQPRSGSFKWIELKSMTELSTSNSNQSPIPLSMDRDDYVSATHQLFSWLRQRVSRINDPDSVLSRFGLRLDQSSRWLPVIASHPLLFTATAYRGRLFVERLIVELNILSLDLVHRILRENKDNMRMLDWLVAIRKVKRLYDHYRVMTSGFSVTFRSELLDKIWLQFNGNTYKMDGLTEADDTIFEKTKYFLDDLVFHLYTSMEPLCMGHVPQQMARNVELFGEDKIEVKLLQKRIGHRKITPFWDVSAQAPKPNALTSWFQTTIGSKEAESLKLVVSSHRGHYGSSHPKCLLEKGSRTHYDNDIRQPVSEDWIIFEKLVDDTIPTTISISNSEDRYSLKSMKIDGSVDNNTFEEWIQIDNIWKGKDVQHFTLDPSSVFYAWKRRFRYFRLSSMESHGRVRYLYFYEFGVLGVAMHDETDSEKTRKPSSFNEVLCIDENDKIVTNTEVNVTSSFSEKIELKKDEEWIDATACRQSADKVCVKWTEEAMLHYQWIHRNDFPNLKALRIALKGREQIPDHIFAAAIGKNENVKLLSRVNEYEFGRKEKFEISLNDLVAFSGSPRTVSIYAKPIRQNCEFQLIKELHCTAAKFTTFAVRDVFYIDQQYTVKSTKFEVMSMSNIMISNKGSIDVSKFKMDEVDTKSSAAVLNYGSYIGDENANKGIICLVSGGNVVNEGILSCGSLVESKMNGGTVYIDTDGVFHNKGVINCGENGCVMIKCSDFQNDGVIIPIPKVIRKVTKENLSAIEQLTATDTWKHVKLNISAFRGYYNRAHPTRLLQNGTEHYSSEGQGPPNEDWITFRTQSGAPIYPTDIVIWNCSSGTGLKVVEIEGSADGIGFDDWIRIEHISVSRNEAQSFVVGPAAGYFAWERGYTYFKLKVVENHGGSYNTFYEFAINGVNGK